MGFSVRLAPGVRVRASSRGVRASIGPRAARVHVGSGRTGFSTGVGPVSYYTSVGGSRSNRGTASPARRVAAPTGTTPAAQAKALEAQRLSAAFDHILGLPRQEFPEIRRPQAPQPPAIDLDTIQRAHRARAKRGTRFWDRAGRASALVDADSKAQAEVAFLQEEYASKPRQWQAELDRSWDALGANDADVVLATLAAAFEDNEAPAAAVGVAGDAVSLVVVVPAVAQAVPDRKPSTTVAGNLSLKKLTKRETSELYLQVVCGHVLATVKECFAVARGASSARVVVVRPGAPDAYGRSVPEALVAAELRRDRLLGVRWTSTDACTILTDCSSDLLWKQKGAAKELQPLDLDDHPQVRAAVDAIAFEDLPTLEGAL